MSCIQYNNSKNGSEDNNNKLKKIDTLHDMYRADRGTDVSYILDQKEFYNDCQTYVDNQLGYVKTLNSHFEPDFESYFESKMDLPSLCESSKYGKVYFTINEIMNDYVSGQQQGPILTALLQNPLIRAIQIQFPSGQTKRELFKEPANAPSLSYVASFIMQFCGKQTQSAVFPIDAKAGPMQCIFQNINNGVNTLATAMTICDSAGGGVNDKEDGGEAKCSKSASNILFNKKFQPLPFPFNDTTARKYNINSNFWTKDIYNIYYTEGSLPFSVKNQSSIVLHVDNRKDVRKQYVGTFGLNKSGTSAVSGTSVASLRDLIVAVYNTKNMSNGLDTYYTNMLKEKGEFDITQIVNAMMKNKERKEDIIGFLLDFKRAGDYEQVDSSKTVESQFGVFPILCTGDVLCSVYARTKNLSCAYVHSNVMDLFKTSRVLSAEEQKLAEKNANIARTQAQLNTLNGKIAELTIIETSFNSAALTAYIQYIDDWKNNYSEEPLVLLTMQGLKNKLESYKPDSTNTELFTQYTVPIKTQLGGSSSVVINKDNADEIKTSLDAIDKTYELFFKNVAFMKSNDPYDLTKNLLGPVDSAAMDVESPSSSRSPPKSSSRGSPKSTSARYRSAPFFDINLFSNRKAMESAKEIIRYNETLRGRIPPAQKLIRETEVQQNIEIFKEHMFIVLDNYVENMSILQSPGVDELRKIETLKQQLYKLQINRDNNNKVEIDNKEFTSEVFKTLLTPLMSADTIIEDEIIDINIDDIDDIDNEDLFKTSIDELLKESSQKTEVSSEVVKDPEEMVIESVPVRVSSRTKKTPSWLENYQTPIKVGGGPFKNTQKNAVKSSSISSSKTKTNQDPIKVSICDVINKLDFSEIVIDGSNSVLPFIDSNISNLYPGTYYDFLTKQLAATTSSEQKNYIQSTIDNFPSSEPKSTIANYDSLYSAINNNYDPITINAVYNNLRQQFNTTLINFLNRINNDNIVDSVSCLSKEIKVLIFLTNLITSDEGLLVDVKQYGKQSEIFQEIINFDSDITTPGSSGTSGQLSNASQIISYAYQIQDIKSLQLLVIQFFAFIKKYIYPLTVKTPEEQSLYKNELYLLDYFKVSDESQALIDDIIKKGTLNTRLDILMSYFMVPIMKTRAENITSAAKQRARSRSNSPDTSGSVDPTNKNPKKRGRSGGKRTRRKRVSRKKRTTRSKGKKQNKKRVSKKHKKRNLKKRTMSRKK